MKVIPLICRNCGLNLEADQNDVLFYCPDCRKGWELWDNALIERKVYYASTPESISPGQRLLYLPYWVFDIKKIDLSMDDTKTREFFYRKIKGISKIYIEAYESFMTHLYGNMALRYMFESPQYSLLPPQKIVGCTRSSELIRPYLHLYLLKYLDRFNDVTGLDLRLEHGEPYLVAFPHLTIGNNELLDLIMNVKMLIRSIMNFPLFERAFLRK